MPHLPIFNLLGAILFAAWLLLSVFNQFKNKFILPFQRFDIGHLLPRWTFFAPKPGTADYHLVFRDLTQDDQPAIPWTEVQLPARSSWAIVWNPQKRARKVITDMAQALVRFATDKPDAAPFTIPYLALLQRVIAHCPPTPGSRSRQFALVQTYGPDSATDPIMLYRSNAHPFVTPATPATPAAEPQEDAQSFSPTQQPVTAEAQ